MGSYENNFETYVQDMFSFLGVGDGPSQYIY